MNVLHKVTLQALKQNRTRTIVTIIGIILSTAMLCAVTTFTTSMQRYLLDREVYSSGSWHVGQLDITYQKYQQLAQATDVETSVYTQHLGYAKAPDSLNAYKPYFYVLGLPDTGTDLLSIHLTQGRMPTSSNEIVLPQHYLDACGRRYQVGDILTLSVGQRMSEGFALGQNNPYDFDQEETLEETQPHTYTVVGICQRWGLEDYSAPGYTVFTGADPSLSGDEICDVYLSLTDPSQAYTFQTNHNLKKTNSRVLLYSGISRYAPFYDTLYRLAAIVLIIIVAASVILIYNAFAISVSERTRQFGLLSSLGATKKQLRRMVRFEALALSAIGVPLGILSGIVGIGITLKLVSTLFLNDYLLVPMQLHISWLGVLIAVVLGVVTVLLSAWIPSRRATKVSAMEAIRQSQDIHGTKKLVRPSLLTRKLFGLPGVLGVKYYKRSAKKYRTTVFSLFLSVVLFVSASSFASSLTQSVLGGFSGMPYDLELSYDPAPGLTEDSLMTQLRQMDGVDQAAMVWEVSCVGDFLPNDLNPAIQTPSSTDEDKVRGNFQLVFVDQNTFDALAQTYSISHGQGIAFDGAALFDSQQGKYVWVESLQTTSCSFTMLRPKFLEHCIPQQEVTLSDGKIYFQYLDYTSGVYKDLFVPVEEAYNSTTLDIGVVSQDWPFYLQRSNGLTLVYPVSQMATIVGADTQIMPSVRMLSQEHDQAAEDIKELMRSHSSMESPRDYAEEEQGQKNLILVIQVFAYGFIALISLVAMTNVFNTISTNVMLRTRDFAMLQSVGMTAREMRRMLGFECILYGTRALILGIPVSIFVSYLIYDAINQGYPLPFQVPWIPLGIACLSVFVVVFATMAYAARKVRKQQLVEALKNENL
ncbi:ABC transporter permease [Pseudoflavonifractor sp. An85]|uniref:ABC transporter permease n=1 Tax=Pseudoflavonifractor sp. An85 TaxID=1965661 RepID=UPI000B37964E|nr:ABC transporter permease [Pseudoflavonifractor sp. An85]OUN24503.1 hypothetical protein B5G37_06860 [Pseudoflavonifractor sp. An85]